MVNRNSCISKDLILGNIKTCVRHVGHVPLLGPWPRPLPPVEMNSGQRVSYLTYKIMVYFIRINPFWKSQFLTTNIDLDNSNVYPMFDIGYVKHGIQTLSPKGKYPEIATKCGNLRVANQYKLQLEDILSTCHMSYIIMFTIIRLFFFSVLKSYDGDTLLLNNIQRSDMGAYLCIASNGIPPSVSKRFIVKVHCKYKADLHDLRCSVNDYVFK